MKERFDYGQNPDKTEGGELISSYGCDHMTADAEFLLSKAKYKAATGREQRRDADVLCYQIRQSFKPGEITPEEANRIGYETAMRWTKGKRFALPNSEILIHQPLIGGQVGLQGQTTDIKIHADHMVRTRNKMNGILSACTGQPLERIEQDTERDNYMTAEEAKAYGLIDDVISQR